MSILLFPLISLLFSECSGKNVSGEECSGWQIRRFDTDLYAWLFNDGPSVLNETDRLFPDEFGRHVIYIGTSDSAGFEERLKKYFSEPTLRNLYKDEQDIMRDITPINKELASGMKVLLENFPFLNPPLIYLHVSGLNQNIILTDSILSLSADKYLGAGYPLYQNFFYDYQRQLMTPERIVPDYLLGFMMGNFPFKGNSEVLLDRILYEGKLRYILSRLIPSREIWEYTAYDEEQYKWCKNQEGKIWKLILENKHLFTPNIRVTEQYINPAPHTAFLPAESPGRVGIWLGFRIVGSYMKKNSSLSLQDLMEMTDYGELLKKSEYKP
ncbi:MAG: gliding motility protein GldB [Candidatus Symbiothrix sp.]|jgi:hypothetical protein|nr:gliding motility protein GldB [Candidatus Symbiothrix sp.]